MADTAKKAAEVTAIGLILIASGKATRYNPGVMDVVVQNRLKWKQITAAQVAEVQGFVALADKKHIGQKVLIELPDGEFVGPFLVVDCGQAAHQAYLKRIGFAVDLSYELGKKYLEHIDRPLWGVKVWLMRDFPTENS